MKSGDDKNFTFQTFLSQNVRVLGLVGETGSLYSCFAQTPAKRPWPYCDTPREWGSSLWPNSTHPNHYWVCWWGGRIGPFPHSTLMAGKHQQSCYGNQGRRVVYINMYQWSSHNLMEPDHSPPPQGKCCQTNPSKCRKEYLSILRFPLLDHLSIRISTIIILKIHLARRLLCRDSSNEHRTQT
jgi:hypothetical protein